MDLKEYICDSCNFKSNRITDYRRHLTSKKHVNTLIPKKKRLFFRCDCGNKYKYMSGLSRHKLECTAYQLLKLDKKDADADADTDVIKNTKLPSKKALVFDDCLDSTTENIETLTNTMISTIHNSKTNTQSIENVKVNTDENELSEPGLKTILCDIAQQLREIKELKQYENTKPVTNNYNNNYILNLNMFLNENCKDALSLQDFVKQLTFVFDDLKDKSWRSKVLLNNLGSLQLENRPFHCIDTNSCQLVLKNGSEWQEGNKDDIVSTLDNCGKHVQKNFGSQWDTQHPEWINSEKKSKQFMNLWCNITQEPTQSQVDDEVKQISRETKLSTSEKFIENSNFIKPKNVNEMYYVKHVGRRLKRK